MKHYVLTRSAFGPEWSLEANRRRLAITRAVTARLMSRQTFRDWTWLVLFDPRDPLLAERQATFAAAAPRFVPILWTPPEQMGYAPWDPNPKRVVSQFELIAASAYHAAWREHMPTDEPILQTRLDDDDGFQLDGLARYQRAAPHLRGRTILMFPKGLRIYGSRFSVIDHRRNAMQTLFTPPGDELCVYDYGHTHCARVAPVVMVDKILAWVWVRHRDTISVWRRTDSALTRGVRKMFPIDWATVEAATA